jgi:uncharacterized Tic20 family protein
MAIILSFSFVKIQNYINFQICSIFMVCIVYVIQSVSYSLWQLEHRVAHKLGGFVKVNKLIKRKKRYCEQMNM